MRITRQQLEDEMAAIRQQIARAKRQDPDAPTAAELDARIDRVAFQIAALTAQVNLSPKMLDQPNGDEL